jgi:hypothetical protein
VPTINVNGVSVDYPDVGDVDWGTNATNFAVQTSAALGKIGLASGTSVDITSTLDVTGATTLDSTLTVAGTTTLNGNTNLGNAITDTVTVTAILNVDSGVLYVDPTSNFVGINTTTPTKALDVTGEILVSSDITIGGILIADDSTNVTTAPPITFTGDTNTGIGRSAADTLDFITNGNPRFRIESTGQIKAVYESQVGTDYNTQLDNGYLCRAWVNFNGTGTIAIRASGNVSSLVDINVGTYSINFTNNLPDVNYAVIGTAGNTTAVAGAFLESPVLSAPTISSVSMAVIDHPGNIIDISYISIGIFR